MKKIVMSDFIVDSKYHCFVCLNKTPHQQVNDGDDDDEPTQLTTIHSLQHLSRFLRMDMKRVFIEKGDIPPHLLAKVETSKLKAHLCNGCAKLNETFSNVCRRLEQIELELLCSLEQIYYGLLKAEDADEYQKLLNIAEDSGEEWMGKLDILGVLRKEAIRKCSIKLQKARPRIKLQNMSKRAITKIMQKNSLKSGGKRKKHKSFATDFVKQRTDGIGIKIEQGETHPEPYFDDPDVDHLSELDFDRGSSTTPPNWQEQFVVKREHKESASRRESGSQPPQQRGKLDPKINKHLERIKSNGKMKYRCRLCGKLFPSKNAPRHIRTVHLKEKSYRCHQCSKHFSQKAHLQVHMRIHSGIRSYNCHLCPKEFFQRSNMKRHLLIHEGKRAHKCNICGAAFFLRSELARHLRRSHGHHSTQTS